MIGIRGEIPTQGHCTSCNDRFSLISAGPADTRHKACPCTDNARTPQNIMRRQQAEAEAERLGILADLREDAVYACVACRDFVRVTDPATGRRVPCPCRWLVTVWRRRIRVLAENDTAHHRNPYGFGPGSSARIAAETRRVTGR